MLAHFILKAVSDRVQPQHAVLNPLAPLPRYHLTAAKNWLVRSIEACGGYASSKGYRCMKGWMPPYPETSGYIIPTLLSLARDESSPELADVARKIGNWLISIQRPDGGFVGYELGRQAEPDVFDTGMILLGFNALIYAGEAELFLGPGRAAADFLVQSMDERGCFVRHISHGITHTYNVRAAWALMAYGCLTSDELLVSRAADCAQWTIDRQNKHGFYLENNFKPGHNANSHGIAYVMRGLLQIYHLIGDERCLNSVLLAAEAVCRSYAEVGEITSEIGPAWEQLSKHICLTGYSQLAIVLYRLHLITGEKHYRATADGLLAGVARFQTLGNDGPWHGAIPGSYPIWGRYAPLQYPNWATKFFIDALLTQRAVVDGRAYLPESDLYAG